MGSAIAELLVSVPNVMALFWQGPCWQGRWI